LKLIDGQGGTAIAIGVLPGHFYPEAGTAMKPLGDGFIELIKRIAALIIFCTVVVGIAGMEDMKKVGKTGGLAPPAWLLSIEGMCFELGETLSDPARARLQQAVLAARARVQGRWG